MHHTHALKVPGLDLKGAEGLLQAFQESSAVSLLAGTLKVVDMRTQDEYESFGRWAVLSGAGQ